MKLKPLIALLILSTLVLGFSVHSFADNATSSVKNKSLVEETPNITNEAEYAEFVTRREGAGQASSVKSAGSVKSMPLVKSLSSGSQSSSRSKSSSK